MKSKVDNLMDMYSKLKEETENRNKVLEDTLDVSERFWDDLNGLVTSLKELEDMVNSQDAPGLEPKSIKEQQHMLEVDYLGFVNIICYFNGEVVFKNH